MDEMKKYIIEFSEDPHTIRLMKIKNGDEFPITEFKTVEPYTEPDMEQVWIKAYDKGYTDAAYNCHERCAFLDDAKKEAYQKGLSDAWETARKIANIPYGEEEKVIGSDGWTFIVNHTASEAIEKIRQYEQEKEKEIQVGDEVIYDGHICVVITPETTKRYGSLMDAEGRRHGFENKEVEKTGRHFSEITEVFAKMKEKE